jgi:hypothetical protein
VLVAVYPTAKVFAFSLFTLLEINKYLHNGSIFFIVSYIERTYCSCQETNFLLYCAFIMHQCIYASAARYFVLFGTLF